MFSNQSLYCKKAFNTFFPRQLFRMSPLKNKQKNHWRDQSAGDSHGYDRYETTGTWQEELLVDAIKAILPGRGSVLDLGCNCGRHLYALKTEGYGPLAGVDICEKAIEFGRTKFDLKGVEMFPGSYDEVLPGMVSSGTQFDMVYSCGSSLAAVHPSFDVVRYICGLSGQYVLLLNEERAGFAYPRLWDVEFGRYGFRLVKYLRPADGRDLLGHEDSQSSLQVYRRDVSGPAEQGVRSDGCRRQ